MFKKLLYTIILSSIFVTASSYATTKPKTQTNYYVSSGSIVSKLKANQQERDLKCPQGTVMVGVHQKAEGAGTGWVWITEGVICSKTNNA